MRLKTWLLIVVMNNVCQVTDIESVCDLSDDDN
jgi:hypothetical protein